MDLKTILTLTKNFLGGTICALLILSMPVGAIWTKLDSERKEVSVEKDKLRDEFVRLANDRAELELKKSDMHRSELERKNDIDRREYALLQREKQNNDLSASLKQRSDELLSIQNKVQDEKTKMSSYQIIYNADLRVQSLIREFSELGVDLGSNTKCGSNEERRLYNIGKSKLDEAYTIAESNGILNRYKTFLLNHMSSSVYVCR